MAADGIHEMLVTDDSIFMMRLSGVLDGEQLSFVRTRVSGSSDMMRAPCPLGITLPRRYRPARAA